MARAVRPAPSDAAPLLALLAKHDLAVLEAERERLMAVIAAVKPSRSTILEGRLKQLTRKALEIRVAIARARR